MRVFNKELRISKYKIKSLSKLFGIILIVLVAIMFFPSTMSYYSSDGEGDASIDVAYSLLSVDAQSDVIRLESIVPSNEFKSFIFSVNNFEVDERNNHHLIDVNMKYKVTIRATTNLPMDYELRDKNNRLIATQDNHIVEDKDGTKWIVFESDEFIATFNSESTETFVLKYRLPETEENKHEKYQDISELIIINIDSEQIV